MADIIIDIASEFTGAKAFTKAQSATAKLEKGVKRLGRSLGIGLSTAAVLSYAKASVRAAAADQKGQQQLALALKNVGLERDAANSEAYIQRLQSEFGVVDDLLRPAYQRLAVATHDTNESQKLLNLSLDISSSTGKDLESVTSALSKAYLGSNTALSKLGVGISKADLKAKSFNDIVDQLTTTFAGSAKAAASTYQGSIDKLGVASNNVKEIIGVGIIDSLKLLAQDQSIDVATKKMEAFGKATNETLVGLGVLIANIKNNKLGGAILGTFGDILANLQPFATVRKLGQKQNAKKTSGGPSGPPASLLASFPQSSTKNDKIAKDTLKINQQSLKLAKAKATFDLQKIQIEAALKGKISEEDAIRLKLMKAIEEENLTNIEKYQKALTVAQEKTKELNTLLETVKLLEIKDPFGMWKIDPVTAAINALTTSIGGVSTQIQASGKEWSSFANLVATTVIRPNLTEWSSSFSTAAASAASATASANNGLTATTAAAIKAAQDAAAASATAIATANKNTADAIAAAGAAATSAVEKLNKDTAAATAAAAKAAQDAIDAANKTATETVASILAKASADAAAAAAASAIGTVNTTTLAGIIAASGSGSNASSNTNITVTVSGDPFTDPNVVAEKIVEILNNAGARGTVDLQGIK
jgi:hypothetical protein